MKDGIYFLDCGTTACVCEVIANKATLLKSIKGDWLNNWVVTHNSSYTLLYEYEKTVKEIPDLKPFEIEGSNRIYIKYNGKTYKEYLLEPDKKVKECS